MNAKPGRPKQTRASALRIFALTFGSVLLLLTGLYLASPWLLARMALVFAGRLGASSLAVETGYPGLGQIDVVTLRIESDTYVIDAKRGSLRYRWTDLLNAKLDGAVFERVRLTLRRSKGAQPDGDTPDIETLFGAVPIREVHVDELLLDMPDIGFLGTGRVSLSDDSLTLALAGIQPEFADRFQFIAELAKSGVFAIQFSERTEAAVINRLSVQGNVHGELMELSGEVALDGYAMSLVSSILGLPAGTGTASANVATVLPWPPPESLGWQDLDVTIPVARLNWTSDDKQIELRTLEIGAQITNGSVDSKVTGTVVGQLNESTITAVFPAAYPLHIESGSISGDAGLQIRLQNPGVDVQSTLHRFAINKTTATQLEIDADINAATDNAGAEGRFATTLNITGDDTLEASGNIDFSGRVAAAGNTRPLDTATSISIVGNIVQAKGSLTTGRFDAVNFDAVYNLASGTGRLAANDSLVFDEPIAADLLTGWDQEYDLDAGQIDTTLQIDWESADELATRLGITLTDGVGHYDDYLADGISGEFLFEAANAMDAASWRLVPASLNIKRIDIGLPIADLTTDVSWSGDTVAFGETEATLLGGRAASPAFDYNIDTGDARFDLALSNVKLADILALEGDDILGSGRLDGTLPVFLSDNRPRVEAGRMEARPPGGSIQVTPAFSGPTGQPGLDFALLALKNFHYEELRCEIEYSETGDLLLGVRLKGSNPDVENGRPIVYNLNISDNIPVLLESLRLQDQVTRQIEKKVEQ